MKPHTLILGVGSPFGDDGVGWAAAEAVRESGWFCSLAPGTAAVECLDRPGAGVLSMLDGVEHAIIIDAMRSDGALGTVREVTLETATNSVENPTSSHGFGLADALRLGKALGLLPPRLRILAVEIGPVEALGDDLSAEVRAALPRLVRCIAARIGAKWSFGSHAHGRTA